MVVHGMWTQAFAGVNIAGDRNSLALGEPQAGSVLSIMAQLVASKLG